jgi:malonate-semialdehyde dehydrogenase (acetylating)/methylmalonate-semialdehyde dehydrogenase
VIRLAELLQEAGLPDGIFNIVNGAQAAVEALCDHEEITALAFVGSTRVAKIVYGRAAQTGKRVLCLGGAKNHLIVVPDADLELTAQNVTASYTGCAGQRCMAASVMVAVGNVDHIISAVQEHSERIELGKDLGTIIDQDSIERITRYIDEAERQGAKILVDGRQTSDEGYWLGPTLIDNVSPDMPAAQEEIFGPVLSIIKFKSGETAAQDALNIANNSQYGLMGGVFTKDAAKQALFSQKLECGTVCTNNYASIFYDSEFGGLKQSGIGQELGHKGLESYLKSKTVIMDQN